MTQAEEFAERFNALEFVPGNVMVAIEFFEQLDDVSEFYPDTITAEPGDAADIVTPAFVIFADAHMEGVYAFEDGSKMRIQRIPRTNRREASVL